MCSMAVAEGLPAAGLVLISYPLHPPGRPDRLRTEHFPLLEVPCLFVSGTRDAFATPAELEAATQAIPGPVTHRWIEGKDHALRGTEQAVADMVRASGCVELASSAPAQRAGRNVVTRASAEGGEQLGVGRGGVDQSVDRHPFVVDVGLFDRAGTAHHGGNAGLVAHEAGIGGEAHADDPGLAAGAQRHRVADLLHPRVVGGHLAGLAERVHVEA